MVTRTRRGCALRIADAATAVLMARAALLLRFNDLRHLKRISTAGWPPWQEAARRELLAYRQTGIVAPRCPEQRRPTV